LRIEVSAKCQPLKSSYVIGVKMRNVDATNVSEADAALLE
jgi:hypothetical protein